jgi:TM2 domain-containing membrane protein YozV
MTNVSDTSLRDPSPKANVSDKNRTVALVLCFLVGIFGVHRFYVGKIGNGIAQIFTLGGLGIWCNCQGNNP